MKFSSITVEVNHAGKVFDGNRTHISRLMTQNGFDFVQSIGNDDLFVKIYPS